MPGRLIFFIFIFALILFFIGFNLGDEYRCNINFGFTVLSGVPVFFTIFVSFVLGLLFSLPLVLRQKKKKTEMPRHDTNKIDDFPPAGFDANDKIKQDAAAAKERFLAKRRGNK